MMMTAIRRQGLVRVSLFVTAANLLSACGGGGGGGGAADSPGGGIVTPAPVTIPTPLAGQPAAFSAEYTRNRGVSSINATAAYARGGDGSGILVAVVDNGVNPGGELSGRVSARSTDLDTTRNAPTGGISRHGTHVSTIIAANYNDFGTVGVAHRATILSVRADVADGGFPNSRVASGIDYAVQEGARVINLSLAGGPASSEIQDAMQRATDAGIVMVFAAGNDGDANPDNPAQAAADPRFGGRVLAVGSLTASNLMANTSNRAGTARQAFIAAPGTDITFDCQTSGCSTGSGTSYAAPHVSGAVAVMLQLFPGLSSRDAVSILLSTATDLGDPGVDGVYGWGKLDLTRAVQPVGALTTAGITDHPVSLAPEAPGSGASPALASALQPAAMLRSVARDSYLRPYPVSPLGPALAAHQTPTWDPARDNHASSQMAFRFTEDARLSLRTDTRQPSFSPLIDPDHPADRLRLGIAGEALPATLSTRLHLGPVTFSHARGELAWASGADMATGLSDSFVSAGRAESVQGLGLRFGSWAINAEQGEGRHRSPFRIDDEAGARLAALTLSQTTGQRSWQIRTGTLSEPFGPLGSSLHPGSAHALPAMTRFVSVAINSQFGAIRVALDAATGATRADGPLSQLTARSSSWRVGIARDCVSAACVDFSGSLSQPLRFESGELITSVVVAGDTASDDYLTRQQVGLGGQGREMDLRLGAGRRIDGLGYLKLESALRTAPGHDVNAGPDLGARISLYNRF